MMEENELQKEDICKIFKPTLNLSNENFQLIQNHTFNLICPPQKDIFKYFKLDENKYKLDQYIIMPKIKEINNNYIYRKKNHYLCHKILNKENINEFEIKKLMKL